MELLTLKNDEEKNANSIRTCKRLGDRKKFVPMSKLDATRMNMQNRLKFRLRENLNVMLRPAQAQIMGCPNRLSKYQLLMFPNNL